MTSFQIPAVREPVSRRVFIIACCAAAAFKIWLALSLRMQSSELGLLDDALYTRQAISIVEGEWLGRYDHRTLAKGPFYPLWIAAMFFLNIPLLLSHQLLYTGACFAVVSALAPLIPRRAIRCALFVWLLFDPPIFGTVGTRAIREGIYPALTLLVFAGLIALFVRLRERPIRNLGWSVGLGVTMWAAWTTREEGIWLVPSALLVLGTACRDIMQKKQDSQWARLAILVLPVVLWTLGNLTIGYINFRYYGVFEVTELRSEAFKRANGALMSVRHQQWNQFSNVPLEVRKQIYQFSPAFASLAPHLDGQHGRNWAELAEDYLVGLGGKPAPEDIRGGWFVWALRDAAAFEGQHESAAKAAAFYNKVADEINAACDDGRLDCGPERSSLAPPFRLAYVRPLIGSMAECAWDLVSLYRTGLFPEQADDPGNVEFYVHIGRTRLALLHGQSDPFPPQDRLDHARYEIFYGFAKVYEALFPALGLIALAAFFYDLVNDFRRRQFADHTVIGSALVLAMVTRIVILSYISVTSFSATGTIYSSAMYPLLLLFSGLYAIRSTGIAAELYRGARKRRWSRSTVGHGAAKQSDSAPC